MVKVIKKIKLRKDHLGVVRRIRKESIGDTLWRVIDKDKLFNTKENKENLTLINRWSQIVSSTIFKLTSIKIDGKGNLVIEANNNVIIQELKMMQNNIINQFKNGSPCIAINKIIYKSKK